MPGIMTRGVAGASGCSVETKISSRVSDSAVSDSGDFARRACSTSVALPLTMISSSRPVPAQDPRAGNLERRLVAGEADVDFLVAPAGSVGVERQDVAAVVDDRELIDQALELGDEMRRDKDRPPSGIAVLVGADDRLDELAPDDRIET